jgi:hypothetical protein
MHVCGFLHVYAAAKSAIYMWISFYRKYNANFGKTQKKYVLQYKTLLQNVFSYPLMWWVWVYVAAKHS